MDKGGNFIGYMYADGVNVSVGLVEEGLAKVHFTAERGNCYKALCSSEARAKDKKLNVSILHWQIQKLFSGGLAIRQQHPQPSSAKRISSITHTLHSSK